MVDPEQAKIPVAAICANCDDKRLMNLDGNCQTCGSDKMFNPVTIIQLDKNKEKLLQEEIERLKRPLVIYHANCRDGFAAAWVFHNFFGEDKCDFFAAQYGDELPGFVGRNVYFVDFCPKKASLVGICALAEHVTVLDHHKTNQEDVKFEANEPKPLNLEIVFDMERSGAGIAWDFFHGMPHSEEPKNFRMLRPWSIDYVEDRDLWRWAFDNSRAVNYYLGIVPYEFKAWDGLTLFPINQAVQFGDIIEQKVRQYCQEVSKNTQFGSLEIPSMVAGEFHLEYQSPEAPIINAPQCDISELLEFQMEKHNTNFAIGFFQRNDGKFQYSLRSKGDFDVSEIAKRFNGGGHRNAAGFESETLVHV